MHDSKSTAGEVLCELDHTHVLHFFNVQKVNSCVLRTQVGDGRAAFHILVLRKTFSVRVASVVFFLILVTTIQATFQRVHSQPGFTFLMSTRLSVV